MMLVVAGSCCCCCMCCGSNGGAWCEVQARSSKKNAASDRPYVFGTFTSDYLSILVAVRAGAHDRKPAAESLE